MRVETYDLTEIWDCFGRQLVKFEGGGLRDTLVLNLNLFLGVYLDSAILSST